MCIVVRVRVYCIVYARRVPRAVSYLDVIHLPSLIGLVKQTGKEKPEKRLKQRILFVYVYAEQGGDSTRY